MGCKALWRVHDETGQSTSLFKRIFFKRVSLAFLTGAGCLVGGSHQAVAVEAAAPFAEPSVIYADQPAQRPEPIRTAYAERSSMGGGFIEFLFSDGPPQGSRYQQQPAYQPSYQQQPGYEARRPMPPQAEPQQVMRRQDESIEPARPAFDPKFE